MLESFLSLDRDPECIDVEKMPRSNIFSALRLKFTYEIRYLSLQGPVQPFLKNMPEKELEQPSILSLALREKLAGHSRICGELLLRVEFVDRRPHSAPIDQVN